MATNAVTDASFEDDVIKSEVCDHVADHYRPDVANHDVRTGLRASLRPTLTDLRVFDEPALAAPLTVQCRTSFRFEQHELCHVVGIVGINSANIRIGHSGKQTHSDN